MTLYGIKNCDTVRKARKWLAAQGVDIDFHDFREQGLTAQTLQQWVAQAGWEALLNKRSTSFRALAETEKNDLDEAKAITLMLANPTLIKRPVLMDEQHLLIGFNAAEYQTWLTQSQQM